MASTGRDRVIGVEEPGRDTAALPSLVRLVLVPRAGERAGGTAPAMTRRQSPKPRRLEAEAINETHDPLLESWVTSANSDRTHFPIQNLPYGTFRRRGTQQAPRVGVAIGDQVVDLARSARLGLLNDLPDVTRAAVGAPSLGPLMALSAPQKARLRRHLIEMLDVRRPASGTANPRADGRSRDGVAGRRRRLHRLLRVDFPCAQRRETVPAGQSPAAKLPARADRLSRPQFVDCDQRDAGHASVRADQGRGRTAPVRADREARL